MYQVKNLLFQPLVLQEFHLNPRETRPIAFEMVSDELRSAAKRGFLVFRPILDSKDEPEPKTTRTRSKRK